MSNVRSLRDALIAFFENESEDGPAAYSVFDVMQRMVPKPSSRRDVRDALDALAKDGVLFKIIVPEGASLYQLESRKVKP